MDWLQLFLILLMTLVGCWSGALKTSFPLLRPASIAGTIGFAGGVMIGTIGGAIVGGLIGFVVGATEDRDPATVAGMLPGIMLGMLGALPLTQTLVFPIVLVACEGVTYLVMTRKYPHFRIKT